jgi:hypothetical protein
MMARPGEVTLSKVSKLKTDEAANAEPSTEELFGRRKPPEQGRFRLQVDRQTKGSYGTREVAEAAGLAIKRGFPILHVSVYDAEEGQSTTILVPEA